ncbi:metalloprotease TldD [Rhodoferax sp. 4810]|uniref:Metalloprotease TldD n=1 Tax=Thiospirillum jenense TaxID=1653858 RepID=A0A839H7I0_9GAMM|nr:metalloprotease TldD [Rhodoferax jenense]MBB1125291.1 metalloprotease TldD [Thiospirillum jenense]
MNDSLTLARAALLIPYELTDVHLEQLVSILQRPGVTLADVYFQTSRFQSWTIEDGRIKEGHFSIGQGVGLRAVCSDKTGFAYSDELHWAALKQAAMTAAAIARHGGGVQSLAKPHIHTNMAPPLRYAAIDPIDSQSDANKVALLQRIDDEARRCDPRVTQVIASLTAEQEIVLIVRDDGLLMADVRPLIRLNVNVIVTADGRREQGTAGGGGRYALDYFLTHEPSELALQLTREAVRQALIKLEAQDAPAGCMTVVLGNGWPGVLLHEAVGHGLEGDFNRKGTSAFSGRIGQRVAAAGVTVIDDGTLPQRRGSLNCDDEGELTRSTTLIEDGILVNYMQDRLNAKLMNMAPTGNGRRQSYAYLPLPRMTNTYMQSGNYDPQEIIASVTRGLYAVNFGGGQVDITSGKFVFSTSEAYLIENGKIGQPVKGAMLIGHGPEVLTRITMIGNDLALDAGVGTCGKDGQNVPVGVGQPTLRVNELTVGGTQT